MALFEWYLARRNRGLHSKALFIELLGSGLVSFFFIPFFFFLTFQRAEYFCLSFFFPRLIRDVWKKHKMGMARKRKQKSTHVSVIHCMEDGFTQGGRRLFCPILKRLFHRFFLQFQLTLHKIDTGGRGGKDGVVLFFSCFFLFLSDSF